MVSNFWPSMVVAHMFAHFMSSSFQLSSPFDLRSAGILSRESAEETKPGVLIAVFLTRAIHYNQGS